MNTSLHLTASKSDSQESNPVVEVFKTNVSNEQIATKVLEQLAAKWPDLKVNFDLQDCDKILRIASTSCINILGVIALLEELDVKVSILED